MKRNPTQLAISTWLALLVGIWTFWPLTLLQSQTANPPVPAALSTLLTVEGTVEVNIAGATNWVAGRAGQALQLQDRIRTGPQSRATLQLSDKSVLRVNQLTTLQLLRPTAPTKKPLLDFLGGSASFFSRERPRDVEFRTRTAVGAIRGTEFHLAVAEDGATQVALVDGAVDLSNDLGAVTLAPGELGTVTPGGAPQKTVGFNLLKHIQWCFYYPGVLDADGLALSPAEKDVWAASLEAYRAGDLLQALAKVPAGTAPTSPAGRVYHAAVQLAVGHVEGAEAALASVPTDHPEAAALRWMIATVQGRTPAGPRAPTSSTGWLAESYVRQANLELEGALAAARESVRLAPAFGFGWERVAELEFGFGRVAQARAALETALQHAPRNAQGLALKGFLLAAENRVAEATGWFEQAMAIDGGLANAWLGRGLCRIRQGQREAGREDLQVAATLEPQRAVLRSYLAKAFSHDGENALAHKDLRRAQELDPNDPTAWLYAALILQQENRINEAVDALERSQDLNDQRALFRSRFLLDQDRAVRSANLARAYQDAGMTEFALSEAARAVAADYANPSSHQFLADSYFAARDPRRINLRYDTTRVSEWLMSNLLGPVGGGNLSSYLSQEDYGRLFQRNRLGLSSWTEYYGHGDWSEVASQYGTYGNFEYALEGYYRSERGYRPNNDLERKEVSLQAKYQVGARDVAFLWGQFGHTRGGDLGQYYSQTAHAGSLRIEHTLEPDLVFGYRHEWQPGVHTLFALQRLADAFALTDGAPTVPFHRQMAGVVTRVDQIAGADFALDRDYTVWTAQLQQLFQVAHHSVVAGGTYSSGTVDAQGTVNRALVGPLSAQDLSADVERFSAYGYYQWQVVEPLSLSAGLSYERLESPSNMDLPPLVAGTVTHDRVSPKAGAVWTPWRDGHLRAAFSRSLAGFRNEGDARLEPTQVAGVNQTFRSVSPESAVGVIPGADIDTVGVSFDQSFRTRTYLVASAQWLRSEGERLRGVFTNSTFLAVPDRASSTRQTLDYEERTLALAVSQLLDREWSVGAQYRISFADLDGRFVDVPLTAVNVDQINQDEEATLQQLRLFVLFHHHTGFFSQLESVWSRQNNAGYSHIADRPGDDFWQHNFYVGYRFPRRAAELRLGLLNLADRDYQLNPLNLYQELPRERTLYASLKFSF